MVYIFFVMMIAFFFTLDCFVDCFVAGFKYHFIHLFFGNFRSSSKLYLSFLTFVASTPESFVERPSNSKMIIIILKMMIATRFWMFIFSDIFAPFFFE